jgi:hypothetical protein
MTPCTLAPILPMVMKGCSGSGCQLTPACSRPLRRRLTPMTMRRRARPSLPSSRVIPGGSISPRPVAHGRLAADRAGARQSAHRGGG